jgi:hypothetical protein
MAQRVVSLHFQCLDAIGVKADIARVSRGCRSEAIDPERTSRVICFGASSVIRTRTTSIIRAPATTALLLRARTPADQLDQHPDQLPPNTARHQQEIRDAVRVRAAYFSGGAFTNIGVRGNRYDFGSRTVDLVPDRPIRPYRVDIPNSHVDSVVLGVNYQFGQPDYQAVQRSQPYYEAVQRSRRDFPIR